MCRYECNDWCGIFCNSACSLMWLHFISYLFDIVTFQCLKAMLSCEISVLTVPSSAPEVSRSGFEIHQQYSGTRNVVIYFKVWLLVFVPQLLPLPRRLRGQCCVSVCQSVSRITGELMSQFHWNLVSWLGRLVGRTY